MVTAIVLLCSTTCDCDPLSAEMFNFDILHLK